MEITPTGEANSPEELAKKLRVFVATGSEDMVGVYFTKTMASRTAHAIDFGGEINPGLAADTIAKCIRDTDREVTAYDKATRDIIKHNKRLVWGLGIALGVALGVVIWG